MICMNRDRRSFLLSGVAAPFVQTAKRSAEQGGRIEKVEI